MKTMSCGAIDTGLEGRRGSFPAVVKQEGMYRKRELEARKHLTE